MLNSDQLETTVLEDNLHLSVLKKNTLKPRDYLPQSIGDKKELLLQLKTKDNVEVVGLSPQLVHSKDSTS